MEFGKKLHEAVDKALRPVHEPPRLRRATRQEQEAARRFQEQREQNQTDASESHEVVEASHSFDIANAGRATLNAVKHAWQKIDAIPNHSVGASAAVAMIVEEEKDFPRS